MAVIRRQNSNVSREHRGRRLRPVSSSSLVAILLSLTFVILNEARTCNAVVIEESEEEKKESLLTSPFRIVIDAGSTGSRLHIFEFVSTAAPEKPTDSSVIENPSSLPSPSATSDAQCFRRGSSKAWTPLAAFARQQPTDTSLPPEEADKQDTLIPLNATHVAHHMLPLFDYASQIIPPQYHSTTPVRIAATAGMRLISETDQIRVYDALYKGLWENRHNDDSHSHYQFGFTNLTRDHIGTLGGEREGFYGAVAANYLRGVIDAELRVIVPSAVEKDLFEEGRRIAEKERETDHGLCTNKFGMCEQNAEDVVFGPSHHYFSQQHDVRVHGPLGALDMGGSSTQIVFRYKPPSEGPTNNSDRDEATEENIIPSHLIDNEFFSTSYLAYGADQFRERLWDLWVSEAQKNNSSNQKSDDNSEGEELPVILNPCSFVGYQMSYKGHFLKGTGDAVQCAEQVNRLIPHRDSVINLDELYDENMEFAKSKEPSSKKKKMVGGVEHPPIHGKFYGMSLYFFTLDCLRELSDPDHPIRISWPSPSIEELTHALDAFCARRWQGDLEEVQHEAHEHTRAAALPHRCVEAVYMVTLLRDGFGFHPSSRDITFTQWVDGNEVEWSLGLAIWEFAAERRGQEVQRWKTLI